jgi:hypothetical protein
LARFVAIAVLVVTLIGGALHSWRPVLTDRREVIASSPGVEPLFSRADVALAPTRRLCIAPVLLTPRTARVQMKVDTARGAASGLEIEVDAVGYNAAQRVPVVPAHALLPIAAYITPPSRNLDGRVCLANHGRRAVNVLATNEAQSLTTAQATVDARPVPNRTVALLLLEAKQRSVGSRLSTIFDRAAQLTGGLIPAWLLSPVLVLMLVGVPLAAIAALWLSMGAGRAQSGASPESDVRQPRA